MTGRATRVAIDPVTHADVFSCTVPEVRWNGWACPTFHDREVAERVIAMATRDGQDAYNRFRWTTDRTGMDVLLWGQSDGNDADGEWWWEVAGDAASGYSIGAWYWTWSEVDDLPTDPVECDRVLAEQAARTRLWCDTWNAGLHAGYAERPGDVGHARRAAEAAVEAAGLVSS